LKIRLADPGSVIPAKKSNVSPGRIFPVISKYHPADPVQEKSIIFVPNY
jgi:hypothetical protein